MGIQEVNQKLGFTMRITRQRLSPLTTMAESTYSTKPVAIVTGAAAGLGRGIALHLATDCLVLVVNNLPKQSEALVSLVVDIEATNGKATPDEANATVRENIQKLVALAVSTYRVLDVVSTDVLSK